MTKAWIKLQGHNLKEMSLAFKQSINKNSHLVCNTYMLVQKHLKSFGRPVDFKLLKTNYGQMHLFLLQIYPTFQSAFPSRLRVHKDR